MAAPPILWERYASEVGAVIGRKNTHMKLNLFKSILLLFAFTALLATTGCIIPVDDGGGRGHGGYSDRGDHGGHDDHHGGDHHDDDHH